MNKICEHCDTRNRLHLCDGQDGDFQYCFRPVGSFANIPGNITPYNDVIELYAINKWLHEGVELSSLKLSDEMYGIDGHMKLLYGKFYGDENVYPVGYVIC